MRFRCESCDAQYAIADEKLGKKGVRIRCKKCGEIITVRPPQPEEQDAPDPGEQEQQAADQAEEEREAEGSEERDTTEVDRPPADEQEQDTVQESLDLGEDDELKSALDDILGDVGSGDEAGGEDEDFEEQDYDRQSTRVFNVEEMQKVKAEREQASLTTGEEESTGMESAGAPSEEPGREEAAPPGDEDREREEWYAAVDDEQVGPMSITEFAQRWKSGEFQSDTLVWKTGFEEWVSVFDVQQFAFLAEDEEPAGEDETDWASRDDDAGGDWSSDESEHPEERDPLDSDWDEHEEADSGGPGEYDDYYDGDEPSSSASAEAFAGADVDWRPSALAALSGLAEEELASLRPEDPEPEEDDFPLEGEHEPSGTDGEALEDGEMEEGDSSLISQIAAEEEAAARRAEKERLEEDRQAEELRRKEDEAALEAQAAASREKIAEQRERAAPPEEKYIPQRTSLPKWAIGTMIGLGSLVLVFLTFMFSRMSSGPELPAQQALPPAPPPGVEEKEKGGGESGQPVVAAGVQPAPGPGTAVPSKPEAKPEPKPEPKPEEAKKPAEPQPAKKPPKARKRRRRRKDRKSDRVAVAPREPEPSSRKPPPERKPVRTKPKGGLLDFEDDDDRAFAAETGAKPKPRAPKVEKKKERPPLSNADVLSVMKRHIAEFKACNRKQRDIDSSVRGKMVIDFTIGNNGRVKRVGISKKTAQFNKTYVAGCIRTIIKRLKFPEFSGPPKKVPFPFSVK